MCPPSFYLLGRIALQNLQVYEVARGFSSINGGSGGDGNGGGGGWVLRLDFTTRFLTAVATDGFGGSYVEIGYSVQWEELLLIFVSTSELDSAIYTGENDMFVHRLLSCEASVMNGVMSDSAATDVC